MPETPPNGHPESRSIEELQEADRRKDEFLATLAHELRNSLAPLRSGIDLLRLPGADPADTGQVLGMMDRQFQQLLRLADDLLDISRITRGTVELRLAPVDLASVVHSAIEAARTLIESHGHALEVSLPGESVVIQVDAVRLTQVLSNLLHNAAKYTDPGGRIWLAARRQNNEVVVSVKDNGIGIPPTMLPSIFDMFQQVDRSIERSQGGLGVGLTIVKRLVELHGGSIEAKSAGQRQGSEFVIRLPSVVKQPAATSKPIPTQNGSDRAVAKRRVLVVDDNRDAAASLALLLKIMGHELETAHDGLAAVETAARFKPDFVLLDIGLPKLNGYEAARRIRELFAGEKLSLIAVTGWGQEEDKRRAAEAGFDHHLVKPVDPAALKALLANLQPVSM